jgi:putative transposase
MKPCPWKTKNRGNLKAIHKEFKGAYGSPRMVRELRARGFPVAKPRVERLMRENG